jgi:Uma2 family endonuclease
MATTPEASLTIEQYEQQLEEGARWIELVAGRLVRLEPPDERHGDVVRNLSRPLAAQLKSTPNICACFELPLVVSRESATVRCPAVLCFQTDNPFAETDKLLTETRPDLVIEVASTNDRREGMSERVKGYLAMGVPTVWVIDPITRHAHVFQPPTSGRMLKENQALQGEPLLPGFSIMISTLFEPPPWDRRK